MIILKNYSETKGRIFAQTKLTKPENNLNAFIQYYYLLLMNIVQHRVEYLKWDSDLEHGCFTHPVCRGFGSYLLYVSTRPSKGLVEHFPRPQICFAFLVAVSFITGSMMMLCGHGTFSCRKQFGEQYKKWHNHESALLIRKNMYYSYYKTEGGEKSNIQLTMLLQKSSSIDLLLVMVLIMFDLISKQ